MFSTVITLLGEKEIVALLFFTLRFVYCLSWFVFSTVITLLGKREIVALLFFTLRFVYCLSWFVFLCDHLVGGERDRCFALLYSKICVLSVIVCV